MSDIKKKFSCENENKNLLNPKQNEKEINSNIIGINLNNQELKNKIPDFIINKKNLIKNQTYQNNLSLIKENENNFLSKIIIGNKNFITKKDENPNNIESLEVKVIFDRKTNKVNNNNLLKDTKTKKLKKMEKENVININKNKLKFPKDNTKKKNHQFPATKKTFNNNKVKINEDIFDFHNKENKKESKIKNNNLDTGTKIFNNKAKKELPEKNQENKNTNSNNPNDIFENIFLLKSHNQLYNNSIDNKDYNLYYIKFEDNLLDKNEQYSTTDDYEQIINNNFNDKLILSQKLLQLKKRNWYYELKIISDCLKENMNKINKDNYLDLYLGKINKIFEQFNWIINSISTYYNILFQNIKKFNPYYLNDINLPEINSSLWLQGFEWKGLFIISMPEDKSFLIRKEINAMKYCFFDYLQIIEKENIQKDKKLTNEIIFPLIGYSIVNGTVIYISAIINPDRTFNNNSNFVEHFIEEIICHNKGIINYYPLDHSSCSNKTSFIFNKYNEEKNNKKLNKKNIYELIGKIEKNYYIENLLESRLFLNMSEFHLIPFLDGKFILINASKLVPNLFEKNFKNYKQINVFSDINHTQLFDNFLYDRKSKTYLYKNDNQKFKNYRTIMEKYNLNNYMSIQKIDIIIEKVHFTILHENIININKSHKSRRFVDNLINSEKNYLEYENKNMKYIGTNYLIIYDLVEPLKLEYALIKKIKNEKKNKLPFYFQTNYISYFLSWCKSLSKNSYNIKTYSELKYSMKRFGINSNLKFFSLFNIENDEIKDIIKISILTKFIKYIFNPQVNNTNYNEKTKFFFEDERIGKIFFIIKSILYFSELSPNERYKAESLYEGLVFYSNIFLFKMRLIDNYLTLGLFKNDNIKEINHILSKDIPSLKEELNSNKDINNCDLAKILLKNLIYISRRKPFLFLSELELKLNFIINPFIKFKSSISLESMYKQLKLDHIFLNSYFNIYTYINSDELSGFILAKSIKDYENKDFKYKNINLTTEDENSIEGYKNFTSKTIKKKEDNSKVRSIEIVNIEKISFKQFNNSKNSLKNNNSSRKCSVPNSPIKKNFRLLEKENPEIKWSIIDKNMFFKLPVICYKMKFEYETFINLNNIFKDNYHISDIKILFEHFSKLDSIFTSKYSCDGKKEKALFYSLIPLYLISFFVEKNQEESKKILKKIIEINYSQSYLFSLSELALINLFQGLSCESYLESEEPYSKTLMLLLMLFGDPRGRNNDSHLIMQLPLWKIVRKTFKLEREKPQNNQYFYEMYKSLEFFNSSKDKINTKISNNFIFDYEKNISNNIKIILKLNDFIASENEEQNNNQSFQNYINEELYLSKYVFSDEILNLYLIKNFKFPFVEEQTNSIIKRIYSDEFIIFLFKQIQSILIGKYKIYDEKFINEHISSEILNLIIRENRKKFLGDNNFKNLNRSSINIKADIQKKEIEFSPSQLINAFQQGKKIFDLFSFNSKFNKDSKKNKNVNNSPNNQIISKIQSRKNPSYSIQNNKKGKFEVFSHFIYDELLDKLSYKKNAPSGIIVAFGNNSHYETTYEDYKIIKYPMLIYKLKNIIVKNIFSGWEHNIIISNTKDIYSFGNNNNFQCGFPYSNNYKKDNVTIKTPENISSINGGIKGISAACGNEHTLILDNTNNVYSFGNNEDGVLGVENSELKSYSFIKVNFGKYNGRIKDISAGTIHNVALTDDGNIFSWGSTQGGQLGLSEQYIISNCKNFSISSPTLIKFKQYNDLKEQNEIIKISCGEAHTIALNSKNEVFSWGFGSNGQLGLGFCEDSFELGTGLIKARIFTPQKITALQNKKILDIQCGKTFSMFIDSNGGLYSCGINDLYQLGIPDLPPQNHVKNFDSQCLDYIVPTSLEYFLDMKVEKISCGEAHCVAIVKDIHSNVKLIWSWGNNRSGQLGLGDKIKVSLPKPITYLFDYKQNKFENISCGGFHSLCLINHREDINWIEKDFSNNICKIINDIWNY